MKPATRTIKKPAGRTVSLAQVIWTWARLNRCSPPGDVGFVQIWAGLVDEYGSEAVNAAADSYDRDTYIQKGWEGAL